MASLAQSVAAAPASSDSGIDARVALLPWEAMAAALHERGFATTGPLLSAEECRSLTELYSAAERFRKRIVMAHHGYGRGEYQYFSYPLPEIVDGFRRAMYRQLAPIANRWHAALGREARFPEDLDGFLARCHAAGQTRPTPLLLKYGPEDFNHLHQDLYGELAFPFQVTALLNEPGRDFTGGEFVLVEQRPRMQSRVEVVPLGQGEAVIFAVSQRPAKSARGFYRVNLRHGVSRLRSGQRFTLGVIFHDAA